MKEEVWKDIEGFEGKYQVSDLGRVKSLPRYRVPKERILKQSPDRYGHTFVSLYKHDKDHRRYVHKLVAFAFLNHYTDGTTRLVIDHINEIKSDNRAKNLQIISHKENIQKHYNLKKDKIK